MNREPVYLIKQSELNKLSNTDFMPDRVDLLTDIVVRGNLLDKWDSETMIGNVEKIFDIRKENDPFKAVDGYKLQWRSFYDGWGEGRINMLGEILKIVNGK